MRVVNRSNTERGVSILELALTLPVFMIIVGGMVDLGVTFRNMQVISEAASYGARSAATRAYNNGVGNLSCNVVVDVARGATEEFLTNAGFELTRIEGQDETIVWQVGSQVIVDDEGVPGTPGALTNLQLIEVSIVHRERDCLICASRMFDNLNLATESSFALENSCSPTGS